MVPRCWCNSSSCKRSSSSVEWNDSKESGEPEIYGCEPDETGDERDSYGAVRVDEDG